MKLTTHADRYKGRNPVSKALSPRTPQVLVVAKGHLKLKILLYTDLRVAKEDLFWHRDLGLLTKAFRELGHDAWLVVHPASESASKIQNQKSKISDDPVIWTSPSAVRSPSWWQSHKPNLVILGLWTRPKYDPIRPAQLFWHRDLGQESQLVVCTKLGLVFRIMLMAPCWRMRWIMPLPQNTSRFSAYSGRRAQIRMTSKIIEQIFNY